MILVHGAYHFWPKRVAFRNDYCAACDEPRRSIAVRTFDVGHIFWVPILPVGFWKHWTCCECGKNPHVTRKTSRWFKWAGLFCMILVSVAFWASPIDPDFVAGCWIIRVGVPPVAVLLLIHLFRSAKEPSLRQRLAAILPADDILCPFCRAPLVTGTGERWSCPACSVVRY